MSRYSKVLRRMWNDAKFRDLSAPPPNGQTLWTRLLTAPESTSIPGLFSAWEAGLAEALRWPLEGFREAFREVFAKGMAKADWRAGLVWLPNAINHNRPESPNVVKSWAAMWDELPECPLKTEAYHALKAFVEGMGEAFAKAFAQAIVEPSAKASRNPPEGVAVDPSPNQEQEQEQEQEGGVARACAIPPATPLATSNRAPPARIADEPRPRIEPDNPANLIAVMRGAAKRRQPEVGLWSPGRFAERDLVEFFDRFPKADRPAMGPAIRQRIELYFSLPDPNGWTVKGFLERFNALGVQQQAPKTHYFRPELEVT